MMRGRILIAAVALLALQSEANAEKRATIDSISNRIRGQLKQRKPAQTRNVRRRRASQRNLARREAMLRHFAVIRDWRTVDPGSMRGPAELEVQHRRNEPTEVTVRLKGGGKARFRARFSDPNFSTTIVALELEGWKGSAPTYARYMETPLGQEGVAIFDENYQVIGEWWRPAPNLRGQGRVRYRGGMFSRRADIEIEHVANTYDREDELVRVSIAAGRRSVDFYGVSAQIRREGGERIVRLIRPAYGQRQLNSDQSISHVDLRIDDFGHTQASIYRNEGRGKNRKWIDVELKTLSQERRDGLRLLYSNAPLARTETEGTPFQLDLNFAAGDHYVAVQGELNRKDKTLADIAIFPLRPKLEGMNETYVKRYDIGPGEVRKMLKATIGELRKLGMTGVVTVTGHRITGARNAGKAPSETGVDLTWLLDLDSGRMRIKRD